MSRKGKATPFTSVLVANRGEIALRIMRSVKARGLRAIGLHTLADSKSPHVDAADLSVCIGEGPVETSYLCAERIIAAAQESGADAVHPGYGFLSESADFARACKEAGLVFIGPPASAILAMGNKAEAKRLMIAAGVPCVPGYEGKDQTDEALGRAADKVGYPLMIKAAAGGGGRGMRLVADRSELIDALVVARAEAESAFGSAEVILEKAIQRARHVEVQIFADRHGEIVHLGERDCSVQRRHQKVIEETPCPVLSPKQRDRMGDAAIKAAKAVGYEGAGTVEFLLDEHGEFHFIEMNTRLQVEHAVTEMVTGRDLVALQLDVAAGKPLGFDQNAVELNGCAIEARLYAENPEKDFLPSTGTLDCLRLPNGTGVRVDAGYCHGQTVTPFYDPMLAKIIAWGPDRKTALDRLTTAMEGTIVFGVATNRDFLHDLLSHQAIAEGDVTTEFIAEILGTSVRSANPPFHYWAVAAAIVYRSMQSRAAGKTLGVPSELMGWSSTGELSRRISLTQGGTTNDMLVRDLRDRLIISTGDHSVILNDAGQDFRPDGERVGMRATFFDETCVHVATSNRTWSFNHGRTKRLSNGLQAGGTVQAPMHGTVTRVFVERDEPVTPGTRLCVLEAMKMQHEICSAVDGTIKRLQVTEGQIVAAGDVLIEIEVAADRQ